VKQTSTQDQQKDSDKQSSASETPNSESEMRSTAPVPKTTEPSEPSSSEKMVVEQTEEPHPQITTEEVNKAVEPKANAVQDQEKPIKRPIPSQAPSKPAKYPKLSEPREKPPKDSKPQHKDSEVLQRSQKEGKPLHTDSVKSHKEVKPSHTDSEKSQKESKPPHKTLDPKFAVPTLTPEWSKFLNDLTSTNMASFFQQMSGFPMFPQQSLFGYPMADPTAFNNQLAHMMSLFNPVS